MKENTNVMAVFCNETNRISRFDEMTYFVFYTKDDSVWRQSEPVPFHPDLSGGLTSVRENINRMLVCFNTCKIIITKSITGIPYQVFDQSGFIICESEDFDLDLLDAIDADLIRIEDEANNDDSPVSKTPVKLDETGHYFLDLNKVQKRYPELSSKKVLLPFLENTTFYSLEVVCSHIPPWFDNKLAEMELTYSIQNEDDSGKHVVITHVLCKE
ncbi:Fe-only nitrogenase accessory AnfO family protein [Acetobacterium tundrae]|uniref:Fe-only nitrogenase accessory protein AnfO n=1 Tax=Acetobacterium tundrae TaxID=132932 RepID=A0ABR6WNA2_9FIRM|nr:Fe-only nitrogenase accessory AnfO family protein [Acetobacterium tundrae]MBC3797635.1 hypothetical protein [Acetobacterium tundrae]